MNKSIEDRSIEVFAIVEGPTEQFFIQQILTPYLAEKRIYIYPTQVGKPGQKGGDVRFKRVKDDLAVYLKQRSDTYITTFVDYYGTKEWPGLDKVVPNASPEQIAACINEATKKEVEALFSKQQAGRRFIPYMAIHEFEALLFSDSAVLAAELGISENKVSKVLAECGEPEAINNSLQTAPSKRLDKWANGKFAKTTTGIALAKKIGIPKMREMCPLFNNWIERFEAIVAELA